MHKIDHQAKAYLLEADSDVQDMVPIEVLGDGNCLYNSVVCLAGTAPMSVSELRGKYNMIHQDTYNFSVVY